VAIFEGISPEAARALVQEFAAHYPPEVVDKLLIPSVDELAAKFTPVIDAGFDRSTANLINGATALFTQLASALTSGRTLTIKYAGHVVEVSLK
jgi:hypothetical protein